MSGNTNKSPIKLNVVEIKFNTSNLFMNGENLRDKISPSKFKVTTPENPLLSNQVITSKEILVPYTNR